MAGAMIEKKRTVKLQFHYIKGPGYRETACHGAIGGVTPQKKIWMALFSERGPIPRTVEFEIEADEGVHTVAFNEATAVPTHIEGRSGMIRQVEVSTYMDLDMAIRLRAWLDQRIVELQGSESEPSEKVGKSE